MTIENLDIQITKGIDQFVEEIIQIGENGMFFNELYFKKITKLEFHHCVFKGSYLEFEGINKPEIPIIFNDCTFEINLKFDNCSFKKIQFLNTKSIKNIDV
jgi:hypothetical protein